MLLVEPVHRPAATRPAEAVAYAEQLWHHLPVPFESSARSVTCNDLHVGNEALQPRILVLELWDAPHLVDAEMP
jgi:hypothetical protein